MASQSPSALSLRIAAFALLIMSTWAAPAHAQVWMGSDPPRKGSVEISGGVVSFGGFDLGSRNAEETRNINTGTGAFTLFTADSRMAAAVGAHVRFGVYLSRQLSLETGIQFGRPKLSSQLSGDAEQAPSLTAKDTVARYVMDGSLLYHLRHLSFAGGRGLPFFAVGAGYLRELHESNEFVQTGHEYHAGGGVHVWFGQGKHRLGLRADVGASVRQGGADFGSGRRTVPTGGASLAFLF